MKKTVGGGVPSNLPSEMVDFVVLFLLFSNVLIIVITRVNVRKGCEALILARINK